MAKKQIFQLALLVFTLLAFLSMIWGYSNLGITDLIHLLLGNANRTSQLIFLTIRLPRLIISIMAGGSLALSAHLFQTLTRNPMADSGILGVNAGAGFLLTLATTWNLNILMFQPFLALTGGAFATTIVFILASKPNQPLYSHRLILTGIGLSSLLTSSTIHLMMRFDPYKLDKIIGWLSGRYVGDNWQTIYLTSPLLILLWFIAMIRYQPFNIFKLDDQVAIGLGLNIQQERIFILILATSLASLASILVGNTAFVGLVASHLAQKIIGKQHQYSLPLSILLGAILMLIADMVARSILVGTGIPTGLVVTAIGSPYFLLLMTKQP
ncbi:TPA: iron ABC transporter permease [Streptococcus suis]|nr:iron ABC transporter permease [Streptococcus suis]